MTQRTILIVDDCLEDRETYRRYLLADDQYTYTIWEEEYGENGLELCKQVLPDVILLDFLLPDIDGLEFLSQLGAVVSGNNLPVVMLTGQGNEAIAVQAMKSGAADYLVKGNMTPESLRLAIHNVLERAHLLWQLEQSEKRFRTSVENMLDCFGIYTSVRNESGRIVDFLVEYVNSAACADNCMTKEQQIGKRLLELMPSHGETGIFDSYCQVVETGEPLFKEVLVYADTHDKQHLAKAFDIRVTKLGDGLVAAWRDITERKQADEALRESQRFIQQIADATPDVLYLYDLREQQSVYVNRQLTEILGYTPQAIRKMGTGFLQHLMHPDDFSKLTEHLKKFNLVRNGDILEFEYRMKHESGEWRWFCSRDTVFTRTANGAPHQLLGIAHDITERKRIEEERHQLLAREQEARAAAEAANRTKDEFLAMVSHELRNPLTAILCYSQLLQTPKLSQAAIARASEIIERNTKLQAQLVNDLLDISQIGAGKFCLNIDSVDLVVVIKTTIETVRLAAQTKAIQIHLALDSTAVLVLGDANRLQQVIWNLLSNAIKFTPEGGRVRVQLERVDSHVQITISDTGQGISAEFLPYVFDRFRQADSSITKSHGGLGLGLTIVRHLVELHGGTVSAHSPGIGQGATFVLNLPLLLGAGKENSIFPFEERGATGSGKMESIPSPSHIMFG